MSRGWAPFLFAAAVLCGAAGARAAAGGAGEASASTHAYKMYDRVVLYASKVRCSFVMSDEMSTRCVACALFAGCWTLVEVFWWGAMCVAVGRHVRVLAVLAE